MKIQESGENYLETILILEDENRRVRSVDIANTLGVSKPSVTRAMSVLKQAGYIEQESYGEITLTAEGRRRASEILDRHRLIQEFLILAAGVDAEVAGQDACRIEHVIHEETVEGIRRFVEAHRRD